MRNQCQVKQAVQTARTCSGNLIRFFINWIPGTTESKQVILFSDASKMEEILAETQNEVSKTLNISRIANLVRKCCYASESRI